MKRLFSAFLAACVLALGVTMYTAFAEDAEVTRITWLTSALPDDPENERVIQALNEKLAALDEPLEIVLTDLRDEGDYIISIQTRLAAEDCDSDLISLPSNFGFLKYAMDGAFEDLAPYFDIYPYVYNTIDPEVWKLSTINQGIYAIPTDTIWIAKSTAVQLPSADWEEAPEDPQALLDWIIDLHAFDGSVLIDAGGTERAEPPFFLHRTYPEWPFDVDPRGIFYFDAEGNVEPYIESDIYAQDSGWMWAFRGAGVLASEDDEAGVKPAGVLGGAFSDQVYAERQLYTYHEFAVDKPRLANGDRMYNTVPAGKDPEPVLRFFNWLYSDVENYRLLTHGLPGVHYTLDEYDMPVAIEDETGIPLYWQGASFDHQLAMEFPEGEMLDHLLEKYGITEDELYDPGLVMPFTGFVFDPEPVRAEYDELLAAMGGGLYAQIRDGFERYSLVDAAIDELYRANLDIVMAECERQYEAYKNRFL